MCRIGMWSGLEDGGLSYGLWFKFKFCCSGELSCGLYFNFRFYCGRGLSYDLCFMFSFVVCF